MTLLLQQNLLVQSKMSKPWEQSWNQLWQLFGFTQFNISSVSVLFLASVIIDDFLSGKKSPQLLPSKKTLSTNENQPEPFLTQSPSLLCHQLLYIHYWTSAIHQFNVNIQSTLHKWNNSSNIFNSDYSFFYNYMLLLLFFRSKLRGAVENSTHPFFLSSLTLTESNQ